MSDIHGMYGSFMKRINYLNNLKHVKEGKDKLILLGDYIDVGNNSLKVLKTIYTLQNEVGAENMIVLLGNHDKWFLDFLGGKNNIWLKDFRSFLLIESFLTEKENIELNRIINRMEPGNKKTDRIVRYVRSCVMKNHGEIIRWLERLPLYYKTEKQIYVHAGVNEDAGEMWETCTSYEMLIEKYPQSKGEFYMDIISGHVSTSTASGDRNLHDVYYDGYSHFYIDGVDSYPVSTRDDDRIIPLLAYEECDGYGVYYSVLENGEKKVLSINSSDGIERDIQSGFQESWNIKNNTI